MSKLVEESWKRQEIIIEPIFVTFSTLRQTHSKVKNPIFQKRQIPSCECIVTTMDLDIPNHRNNMIAECLAILCEMIYPSSQKWRNIDIRRKGNLKLPVNMWSVLVKKSKYIFSAEKRISVCKVLFLDYAVVISNQMAKKYNLKTTIQK